MTPRERVLAALNHEQPDRVPIDLSGHRSSGIAAIAYRKLRAALGLPERTIRVYDPVQQLAIVDEDVLAAVRRGRDRTGARVRAGGRALGRLDAARRLALPDAGLGVPEREDGRWIMRSPSGRILAQMPDGALYFEQCYWPYLEVDDLDQLEGAHREHVVPSEIAARPADRRPRRSAAFGRGRQAAARAHGPGHHRPVRRQSAGNRPVPVSQRRVPHAAGRRPEAGPGVPGSAGGVCTCRTWRTSSRPSGRTSTSSCSATTWGCRTARRCRRRCIASSSSRGMR